MVRLIRIGVACASALGLFLHFRRGRKNRNDADVTEDTHQSSGAREQRANQNSIASCSAHIYSALAHSANFVEKIKERHNQAAQNNAVVSENGSALSNPLCTLGIPQGPTADQVVQVDNNEQNQPLHTDNDDSPNEVDNVQQLLPFVNNVLLPFPIVNNIISVLTIVNNVAPLFLAIHNDVPLLPIANNGAPLLPIANNGAPLLPIANNGAPLLPIASNGAPLLPIANNGAPLLPIANNGAPPLPAVNNEAPPAQQGAWNDVPAQPDNDFSLIDITCHKARLYYKVNGITHIVFKRIEPARIARWLYILLVNIEENEIRLSVRAFDKVGSILDDATFMKNFALASVARYVTEQHAHLVVREFVHELHGPHIKLIKAE